MHLLCQSLPFSILRNTKKLSNNLTSDESRKSGLKIQHSKQGNKPFWQLVSFPSRRECNSLTSLDAELKNVVEWRVWEQSILPAVTRGSPNRRSRSNRFRAKFNANNRTKSWEWLSEAFMAKHRRRSDSLRTLKKLIKFFIHGKRFACENISLFPERRIIRGTLRKLSAE